MMPHDVEHNINPTTRFRRRVIQWCLLIALCTTLGTAHILLNRRARSASDAWNQNSQRVAQSDIDARNRVMQAWDKADEPLIGKHATLADAERMLNGGAPLPTRQVAGAPVHVYTDPTTGGEAGLQVYQGQWTGIDLRIQLGIADPRRGPVPNETLRRRVMTVRRLVYLGGYFSWIVLLVRFLGAVATAQPRSERIGRATTLIGVALAATFLAARDPTYWQAWGRFFDEDAPGWGLIAIMVSMGAVAIARRPQSSDADGVPRCRSCGYELTGNVSGVCPECGTQVMLRVA